MNVFEIIGPVMVGPSSSHTAGAVKIGRVVRELLGEEPAEVDVKLHGSFAKTYKGHGTDRAIIAGLMGMDPDDERIRKSMVLAKSSGMVYRFETVEIKDAHPNTASITATGKSGKQVTVQGASVGGGNILVEKINGLNVEFTGQYNTLVIKHRDTPGAVAAVTNLLAYNDINIANMKVYRSFRGGDAFMVIETDQQVDSELIVLIGKLPKVISATLIRAI